MPAPVQAKRASMSMEGGALSPGLFQSPYSHRASARASTEAPSPAGSLDNSLYVTRFLARGSILHQDALLDIERVSHNYEVVDHSPARLGGSADMNAFMTPPLARQRPEERRDAAPLLQGDELLAAVQLAAMEDLEGGDDDVPFEELQLMVPPIGNHSVIKCLRSS